MSDQNALVFPEAKIILLPIRKSLAVVFRLTSSSHPGEPQEQNDIVSGQGGTIQCPLGGLLFFTVGLGGLGGVYALNCYIVNNKLCLLETRTADVKAEE